MLETSVTIVVHKLMFPLLIPPMILASTNNEKLYDTAHIAYDTAIPICRVNREKFYFQVLLQWLKVDRFEPFRKSYIIKCIFTCPDSGCEAITL